MTKTNFYSKSLNVLVARPEKKGRALVHDLQGQGIWAEHCALFSYQITESIQCCQAKLFSKNNDILIFISPSSVEFAAKLLLPDKWIYQTVIAVGQATEDVLAKLGIHALTPHEQTSEGLLTLSILQDGRVKDKNIIIVRGNKGRELLFDTLIDRKANVSYAESYQRKWHLPKKHHINHWLRRPVNCIVVTSVAILDAMLEILLSNGKLESKNSMTNNDEHLRASSLNNTTYWVVASKRIANHAIALGLLHVINANSANNKSLMDTVVRLNNAELKNDELEK